MRRLLPLTLLLLAAAIALPARAAAATDQVMTFEAPRELLADATRDATLDEIKAFGVTRIRQIVYWRDYGPKPDARRRPARDLSDPAAYPVGTWDRLDLLFAAAAQRGIGVQLTLTGPVPRWATKARRDNLTDPDPKAFQAFVTAVGRRYGPQVSLWSIWNEPNQPQFLLPQFRKGKPASPGIYRRLFLAARRGLAASGNADDTVLLGETSPIGNQHIVAPLAFLRGTLCLSRDYRKRRGCARLDADGYAHHAYTKASGPSYKPDDADNVTIGVLDRLVRALDRAGRAGALPRRLPIYLTEFGIQSTPDPISGVSLAKQAEYIAISERLAFYNPRVVAFSQYLMRDDPPRKGAKNAAERYGGFETGLRRSDGRRKPAYAGFRLPLVATHYGGSDVLWGRVRPYPAQTRVSVEARTGKRWKALGTVTTNAAGVWGTRVRHRKGIRYRVRWTAPDGRRYSGPAIRPY